jgi:beta-carotene hydroxylase
MDHNKYLRRKSDLRSLGLIGFTILTMLFLLSQSEVHPLSFFFFTFFVVASTLINHNHRHHNIFNSNTLNNILNNLISICIGAPSTRLHLVHHYNHHLHYPSHDDWSHFELNAKGKGLYRIGTYMINATKRMTENREQLVKTEHHKRSLRNERITLYVFGAIALWWNWKVFLFIILPGWFVGLSLLLASNLLNHDHCDLNSEINHSRDFINGFENWFFCNNGYHTAHHLNPHLHWEELPSLHRKSVIPLKKKEFISGSFFIYLAKSICN